MKKTIALLICFIMLFALCACGGSEPAADTEDEGAQQEEGAPDVGMPNPMTECESLDDVNKAVGGNLCGPGAMGVSDEAYFVINCGSYKIGEFQFKMNGYDYTLRCAKSSEDISGVYLSGQEGTAFSGIKKAAEGEDTADAEIVLESGSSITISDSGMQSVSDDTYKCARWFDGDMQYVLTVNDGGEIEYDTFISAANEIMLKTMGQV